MKHRRHGWESKRGAEMPDPIGLRRLHPHENHDDVVRLIVSRGDEGPVAEVVWPANARTDGGNYLYPTYVPLALERAEDVRQNYGFAEVAVIITDLTLWDSAWGTLL